MADYDDTTTEILNARAKYIAVASHDLFESIRLFKAWLDVNDNAALIALPRSGNTAQITDARAMLIRNSVGDMANLVLTATAQRTQPTLSDFTFNLFKLLGVANPCERG